MTVHLVIGVLLADICVDVPNVLSQVEGLVGDDLAIEYIQVKYMQWPRSSLTFGMTLAREVVL